MELPTAKTPAVAELATHTVLLYGPTKIGKSTWCSHAPDALFLATEPGLNSLEVYQVSITTWEELLSACAAIARGDHQFKTIIIDTIDNAWRMCADFICRQHNVTHEADLPYGKGFQLISTEFHRVITKLACLPYGLYMISHAQETEVETRTGKYNKTVPTLPERARRIVLGLVDMVLFCDLEPGASDEPQRVMRTKPNRYYEAGDRTGRLPDTIPLDYSLFAATFNAPLPGFSKSDAQNAILGASTAETANDTVLAAEAAVGADTGGSGAIPVAKAAKKQIGAKGAAAADAVDSTDADAADTDTANTDTTNANTNTNTNAEEIDWDEQQN